MFDNPCILHYLSGLQYESQCTGCDPGQYCPNSGMTTPSGNCSARYFCTGSAITPSPIDGTTGNKCPVGHYCPIGSPAAILCEPGTYTDTELNEICQPCTQGYFCTKGSNPESCPAGFFCPEGTGYDWQSCPRGTYSDATGLSNATQCLQCSGGYFCDQYNMTSNNGECSAGYFCRSGSDSATPDGLGSGDSGLCPVAHYCESNTQEPVPCPAGTFNNRTMITSEGECQPCLPGYYCELPGLENPNGLCDAGFYCTEGSTSPRPPSVSSTGGPCPVGSSCVEGSSVQKPCSAGYYSPTEQAVSCTECPNGYYCIVASSDKVICPKGR